MRKWTLNNHSSAFNQKSGFLLLLLSLLLLSSSPLRADPTIDRIIPPGAKQGSDVEIELTGKFLESAEELVFEEGLIQVQHIDSVDGSRVKARISIPPDCRLGAHRLRVRTARGLSELRTFRVGATQQVNEIEPNNEPSKAQNIELEQTISGVITGEDVDCFVVHLLASSRIAAVVDGIRLDQEMFDSHLEIIDSRGFVLGANDDNSLLGQDPMLSIVVKEEGDYTIRLRESAMAVIMDAFICFMSEPFLSQLWHGLLVACRAKRSSSSGLETRQDHSRPGSYYPSPLVLKGSQKFVRSVMVSDPLHRFPFEFPRFIRWLNLNPMMFLIRLRILRFLERLSGEWIPETMSTGSDFRHPKAPRGESLRMGVASVHRLIWYSMHIATTKTREDNRE